MTRYRTSTPYNIGVIAPFRPRCSFKGSALLSTLIILPLLEPGPLSTPRALAQSPPASATTKPDLPAPGTSPKLNPFQPGIQLDWQNKSVHVAAHVVLREGPLEFFACRPGKEHESILRLDAAATHIYMAMGLVGLTPGRPPQWDDTARRYLPPEGDLVDLTMAWSGPDGQPHTATANEWLTEVEYARAALPRPWVFGGSQRLPDGVLVADRSGAGIALVDMPDSLLSPSRSHASRDNDLWVVARTDAIPPVDTPVTLVIQAAAPRPQRFQVDFRGACFVDDRFVTVEDFADLLAIQLRLTPDPVRIRAAGTLDSDLADLRRQLTAAGVPVEKLIIEPGKSQR
jgi:hypothetical protein